MIKPYVVIINCNDHTQRYALDRSYNLMKNADIDSCKIGDIVQVIEGRTASFACPNWVDDKDSFVTIWFNYYD